MRSLFQFSCFSLFLQSSLFAVSNPDALAQRLADIKSRSNDHENRIANLLSKPAVRTSNFELPSVYNSLEPNKSLPETGSEIPYIPMPDYNDVSSVEPNSSVNEPVGEAPEYKDPNPTYGSSSDYVGKEDLDRAYAELYESELPSRREGYYFGPLIGIAIPDDGATRTASSYDTYDSSNGYLLGVQLGKDYGSVRAEAEYAYTNFDATGGLGISSHSFMARIVVEKEMGDLVDLRAGLGMGIGFVGIDGASSGDTSDLGFAYDFLLGMGYNLGENWSLCFDYRYYLTAANERYDRIKSHGLVLSANFDL